MGALLLAPLPRLLISAASMVVMVVMVMILMFLAPSRTFILRETHAHVEAVVVVIVALLYAPLPLPVMVVIVMALVVMLRLLLLTPHSVTSSSAADSGGDGSGGDSVVVTVVGVGVLPLLTPRGCCCGWCRSLRASDGDCDEVGVSGNLPKGSWNSDRNKQNIKHKSTHVHAGPISPGRPFTRCDRPQRFHAVTRNFWGSKRRLVSVVLWQSGRSHQRMQAR